MTRLPSRGRFLHFNVPIWLLAVCIAVALILRTTTSAESQERLQGWLPDVLELTEDIEVLVDREIGSGLCMLTLRTAVDVDELLVDWEGALRDKWHAVGRGRDEPFDGVIQFY